MNVAEFNLLVRAHRLLDTDDVSSDGFAKRRLRKEIENELKRFCRCGHSGLEHFDTGYCKECVPGDCTQFRTADP